MTRYVHVYSIYFFIKLIPDPLLLFAAEQEFSRQVPRAEAEKFAARMNSLFIETSAKTAVGVKETFQEVVEKILDTPELWDSGSSGGKGQSTSHGGGGVPGGVQVVGADGERAEGGCAC